MEHVKGKITKIPFCFVLDFIPWASRNMSLGLSINVGTEYRLKGQHRKQKWNYMHSEIKPRSKLKTENEEKKKWSLFWGKEQQCLNQEVSGTVLQDNLEIQVSGEFMGRLLELILWGGLRGRWVWVVGAKYLPSLRN